MHIRGVPREQVLLFPERLEEYIAAENPVRVIDALVNGFTDAEWAAMGFERAIAENTGRPPYHPSDLVALFLWGFLNQTTSSRRLEKACAANVEVIWLLRKMRPDHWTISTFRRANSKAIRMLFRQFNAWCRGEDLFGAELIAVDGSKFRAVNSKDRNFTRTKAEKRLKRIDDAFDRYLEEIEKNDREEQQPEIKIDRKELEEKIERLKNRRGEIVEIIKKLDESGEDQVSFTDPESRSMKTGGAFNVCYNGQIAVDDKHGLIATATVTNAPTDLNQLANTAIEARDFLQVEELSVVADKGYSDAEELKACEEAGIATYVRMVENSKNQKLNLFTKYDFEYEPGADTYHCPAGNTLEFAFIENRKSGKVRCYRTTACRSCPIKSKCTSAKERRIRRSEGEHYIQKADQRARARPEMMQRRKELAEHPFGIMKRWINGGYFLLKGLDGVNAEFSLAAMSFNLKRLTTILGAEELTRRLRTV